MKRNALFFYLFILLTQAFSQNNDELAIQARKAYDSGQYASSIQLYERIVKSGFESSVLYYNLGNAYFRNNEIPSAILFYEKALKLDPTNADIKHNLNFTNNKITDKVEFVPDLFFKRWWKYFLNSVSMNFLAITIIVLLTVTLILMSLYMASNSLNIRKTSFWTAVGMAALLLITVYAAQRKDYILHHHHEAIVFTSTVTVKSSPDAVSRDLFVIHEGLKVELLDQIGEWQEIRIANGSIGWLKKEDIRLI